jgi:ankyrin repeat protein
LLDHGADVNFKDNRGRTPLFYAFVKIGKPFDNEEIDPIETVTSLCGIVGIEMNVKGKPPSY